MKSGAESTNEGFYFAVFEFLNKQITKFVSHFFLHRFQLNNAQNQYWFLQLLDKVTPSQWAAIGVLGSLVFGLLTYLTNLYFKIKEDKRKAARGE